MAKFKPGDKVWATATLKDASSILTTIKAGKYAAVVLSTVCGDEGFYLRILWNCEAYEIQIEDCGYTHLVAELCLEPRHDPYEGDKVGAWDTATVWNPLKRRETV